MYCDEFDLYETVAGDLWDEYRRAYGPRLAADVAAFRERRHAVNRWNILRFKAHHHLWAKRITRRLAEDAGHTE